MPTTTVVFPITSNFAEVSIRKGKMYNGFIQPDAQHKMGQIRKGYNPRDVDSDSLLCRKIEAGASEDGFTADTRGVTVIVKDGGVKVDSTNNTITLTLSSDVTDGGSWVDGHTDGQHTIAGIDKAIANSKEVYPCPIRIQTRGCFPDIATARASAQRFNAGKRQKPSSESNLRGEFDVIKRNLKQQFESNIGWKENQTRMVKNKIKRKGKNAGVATMRAEKIKNECQIATVLMYLATLRQGGAHFSLRNICSMPKGGNDKMVKYMDPNSGFAGVFNSASKHVNIVLSLSDHIQKSMPNILGPGYKESPILTKRTPSNGNLRPVKNQLFEGGGSHEFTLGRELMTVAIYSVVRNAFDEDLERTNASDLTALWDRHGKDVLNFLETEFSNYEFRNRPGDFVNNHALWNKAAKVMNDSMSVES